MEDIIIDEYQILSNIIIIPEYQDYFNELEEKFFKEPLLKRVFVKAKELYHKQQLNLDNVLLTFKDTKDYNKIEKMLYVIPLNEKSINFCIDKLKENYTKNKLREILTNSINSITPNSNINTLLSDLDYKVNKLDTLDEKIDLKANMALTNLFGEIDEIRAGKKSRIRTCIRKYDEMTGGLKGGEMTIIAGRPGTGKTTFALNLACNIARKRKVNNQDVLGKKVYFICLEMSTNQLMSKVVSYESGVNSQIIYSGKWNEGNEFEKINNAVNIINDDYELTFNTDLRYLEDMLTKIKKLKSKNLVDVVIVDYISLVQTRTPNQTIRDRVTDITRDFKLLSLELDIPIILLSQLNREAQSREPTIADLRESGSAEQNSDNILLLYTDDSEKEKDTPIITCNLAKQRAGMVGKFQLKFMKSKNRFQGIEEGIK